MHLTNTMPIETKNKILITGGTGLVGNKLVKLLLKKGYSINILSRKKHPNLDRISYFKWNPESDAIDVSCFEGVHCIINLAGAGVADKRWSKKRKDAILSSRINSLKTLGNAIRKHNIKIDSLMSASAVGYYGLDDSKTYTEEDSSGTDFLASVVSKWEKEVDKLQPHFSNIITLRIGIVLSKNGGAFTKMIEPIKMFVGAPLGTGNQPMPWIHIDDLCDLMLLAYENQWNGTFNAVSGNTSNSEFTKTASELLKKPLILPNIPSFILRVMFGEMAEMILEGSSVSGEKALKNGFKPKFTKLKNAIKDLI